jgi:hypothetical protein
MGDASQTKLDLHRLLFLYLFSFSFSLAGDRCDRDRDRDRVDRGENRALRP